MERNYRQRAQDTTPQLSTSQEHTPRQKEPPISYNPFLLIPSRLLGYISPTSILGLFMKAKRRTPFQHKEKDLPGKLRDALRERIEDFCEVKGQEEERRFFRVTTKSGATYIARVRANLSKVINTRKVS